MNGQSLKKLVESHGPMEVAQRLVPLFWSRDPAVRVDPTAYSIREAWEAMIGPVSALPSARRNGFHSMPLIEAQQSSAFALLTGNVIASQVAAAYDEQPSVLDKMVDSVSSKSRTELYVGIQAAGGIQTVPEGQEYPDTGFTDRGVMGPEPDKRGAKIEITEETVIFDQTGQILQRAKMIGKALKNDREKFGIRAIEDLTGYHSYYPVVAGTPTQTSLYRTAPAGTEWHHKTVNSAAITLVDWTDIDEALALFSAMTDENGDPISVVVNQMLVPRALIATALRIVGATSLEYTGAYTAGAHPEVTTVTPNILKLLAEVGGMPSPLTSPFLSSSTTWYIGDFKSQFVEQEILPLQVVELPGDNRRDVLLGYRARRKSRVYATDDKFVLKLT